MLASTALDTTGSEHRATTGSRSKIRPNLAPRQLLYTKRVGSGLLLWQTSGKGGKAVVGPKKIKDSM